EFVRLLFAHNTLDQRRVEQRAGRVPNSVRSQLNALRHGNRSESVSYSYRATLPNRRMVNLHRIVPLETINFMKPPSQASRNFNLANENFLRKLMRDD